jgi:pimeloyl-ACP methyl ester carboxylesterase
VVVSYAIAADHPDRVDRLAVAEIPGPPMPDHSPPLFVPAPVNDKLWHIPFNRAGGGIAEELVTGREAIFFGYEFAIQGDKLPDDVVAYYVSLVTEPGALAGSLAFYRAWDATMAQNGDRAATPLTMPVLAIGGEESWGGAVGGAMAAIAKDVETVVIPGASHWVAEEAPDQVLAALIAFLAAQGAPVPSAAG